MSIVIPQVGELITKEGELDYISKVGSRDGSEGPFATYGVAVGFNYGFLGFNTFEGYATNKKGNYKYKKGQRVELHRHFVFTSEGYWSVEVKEGSCPVWLEWVKQNQTK
tara:strand:+ start:144 stop:470 length:327 start_codon:yes stop_codon:yes gene_type:complete